MGCIDPIKFMLFRRAECERLNALRADFWDGSEREVWNKFMIIFRR